MAANSLSLMKALLVIVGKLKHYLMVARASPTLSTGGTEEAFRVKQFLPPKGSQQCNG